MPEVMEQIGRMSRAEQIRLAHLLLDAIENGTVTKPTKPADGNEYPFLGCWIDDRSDEEIIRDIEESRTLGREVDL